MGFCPAKFATVAVLMSSLLRLSISVVAERHHQVVKPPFVLCAHVPCKTREPREISQASPSRRSRSPGATWNSRHSFHAPAGSRCRSPHHSASAWTCQACRYDGLFKSVAIVFAWANPRERASAFAEDSRDEIDEGHPHATPRALPAVCGADRDSPGRSSRTAGDGSWRCLCTAPCRSRTHASGCGTDAPPWPVHSTYSGSSFF